MKVRIKTWDKMRAEFGCRSNGEPATAPSFHEGMERSLPSNREIELDTEHYSLAGDKSHTIGVWKGYFYSDDHVADYLDEKPMKEEGKMEKITNDDFKAELLGIDRQYQITGIAVAINTLNSVLSNMDETLANTQKRDGLSLAVLVNARTKIASATSAVLQVQADFDEAADD